MITFNQFKKGIKNPKKAAKFVYERCIKNLKGYFKCKLIRGKIFQKKKIADLLKQDRFCLIILDACRYDYFEKEYKNYLEGNLEKVWGSARDTFEFPMKIFPEFYDLTYISAAVPINSVLDKPGVIQGRPKQLYQGYAPNNHFREIIDVWESDWDFSLGTVSPSAVTKVALKYKNRKKVIVHYYQPHAPYIGDPKLLGYIGPKYGKLKGNPSAKIVEDFRKGLISKEKVKEAYRGNLRLVLKEVVILINNLKDRPVIITADHGELLGEDNLLFHPRIFHPKLFEIPWFVVKR